MRREEISEAVSNIDTRFLLEAETYTPRSRCPVWIIRGGLAAAAVLALALLIHTLPGRLADNVFTVKSCALDLDENGSVVLRETDLVESSDYWGGYCDGENYYVNMGFRYEGTNLKQVTFTTEEGFFARQQITPGLTEDQVSTIRVGPEDRLIVFGREFDLCGSSVTLEGAEMEEGLLLFWGVQAASTDDIPRDPAITAQAVFENGDTQTVQVKLDLSGMAVFGGDIPQDPRDGRPVAYHQSMYYRALPLEDCELVDEQMVTETYTCAVGDYPLIRTVPERKAFDEDGFCRERRVRIGGAFYLPVFHLENGGCMARLYRVPESLEYSPENEARLSQAQESTQAESPDTPEPEDPATAAQPSSSANQPPLVPAEPPAAEKPAASGQPTAPKLETNLDSGFTASAGKASPEKMQEIQSKGTYYTETLALEDCELVKQEAVTDVFTYTIGAGTRIVYIDDLVKLGLFDEDGYCRVGQESSEDGIFLGAVYQDPNGNMWGQIYRVPDELLYENIHSES